MKRTTLVALGCALLGVDLLVAGAIECLNEPRLSIRVKEATLILVGSIARVDDPNHVMPEGSPEPGTSYGGTVRVIFAAREALKGQFHQRVVVNCYQGLLELNGCAMPQLKRGKLAAVFLAGTESPFTLVGGADGIVYVDHHELSEFRKSVSIALSENP